MNEGAGSVGGGEESPWPNAVDHRVDGTEGPTKDQGMVGDCTAFSLSTVMENALRRAGNADAISPSHLWAHYGMPNMGRAGDENLNRAISTLDAWPYSPREACELSINPNDDCAQTYGVRPNTRDADLVAKLSHAEQNGADRIAKIGRLESPINIEQVVAVLASGADVWIALEVDPWKWAVPSAAVIPDWSTVTAAHAVALAGYRGPPGARQFLVHNSWGDSWGDHGYGWLSEQMIRSHTQDAYRVYMQVQPRRLTDDDCGPDELVDATSGQCATICTDGSRRRGGQCPVSPPSGGGASSGGQSSRGVAAGLAAETLGDQYAIGNGVPLDAARAQSLYIQAFNAYAIGCDTGDGEGCMRLGAMYLAGKWVAQDRTRGVALTRKGCALGSAASCGRLRALGESAN